MRVPTPRSELYAWHARALLGVYGDGADAHPDDPQCGWYKRKLVKGGVYVPARIWVASDTDIGTGELIAPETILCEVNGERMDAHEQWGWLCAHPISEAEFRYLEKLRDYVVKNEPDHPLASPKKPVDWMNSPMPKFRKE